MGIYSMNILQKIKESEDPVWEIVLPISETICIAAGIIIGFDNAGIGGAIVGIIVGAVVGFLSIPIGGMLLYAGAVFLTLGVVAAVLCAVGWIISSLWGVGKP